MRRVLGLVVVVLLALTGCAQALGTADWDKIEVTFTATDSTGDYHLVVTPTEASYTLNGKETTDKLPDGAWTALTTGVRAFGDRTATACADKGAISIAASAKGVVKQSFQANSCDAGDVFEQAQALVAQIVAQL